MTLDPQFVGSVQLLGGMAALLFFKPVLDNRDKPESRSFAVYLSGVVLWIVPNGAGKFISSLPLSVIGYNIILLGAKLTAAGWLLIAITATNRGKVTRRLLAALAIWITTIQILLWTNPLHQFMFTHIALDGVVLVSTYNVGFWIHAGIAYGIGLVATGLLVVETVKSTGLRRKQMLLLALTFVPIIISNLLTVMDVLFSPYDLSVFGYLIGAVIFALVLFKGRFLDVVTVARRTAMAEIDDAMITVDEKDRVIDANVSARALFDVGDDYVGMSATEFFAPIPQEVQAQFANTVEVDTEVAVQLDGEQRHFSLSISALGEEAESGRVFVLRDITALKEREQELKKREQQLDLMRQVQSRVLRHNIRNDLQVVKANNEVLADEVQSEHTPMAKRAIETTEKLLSISDKARTVEQLIDQDQSPTQFDLSVILRDTVERYRSEFPDVTFTLTCPDECFVEASPSLELVFENVIQNAAEHNETDGPTVDITVSNEGGSVAVTIADNGPGISDHELTVLEAGEETALEHGSGMGLWIVQWVIDNSATTITYDTGHSGTDITIRIPR